VPGRIVRTIQHRERRPKSNGLLLLNGNTALADIDFDAGGLLPLLELIAEDRGGDGEYADDQVENVAIHDLPPGLNSNFNSSWMCRETTSLLTPELLLVGSLPAIRF
jgi:hypothetical protein